MNRLVKSLYMFLCFGDQPNTSEAKNMKEFAHRLRWVFTNPGCYEFMEKCGRPGNYLYGEFMLRKINRIKGKINSSSGICL